MRDIVVPGALILVVALLGGLVYFGFRPSLSGPGPAAETAAEAAKKAEAAEREAARQTGSRRRTAAAQAVASAVEDLSDARLDIPDPPMPSTEKLPPPFPSDKDVLRGMPRNRLRALYGPPSLRLSATRDGRLVERYVYMKPDRTAATVAHLENGAVVLAETVLQ